MMKKIKLFLSFLSFFLILTSCQSVKQGLTGSKKNNKDEFLVQKKDPLVLPPDYENLPSPDEKISAAEEISDFEKSLEISVEKSSTSSSSTESSIIKKIQSK